MRPALGGGGGSPKSRQRECVYANFVHGRGGGGAKSKMSFKYCLIVYKEDGKLILWTCE